MALANHLSTRGEASPVDGAAYPLTGTAASDRRRGLVRCLRPLRVVRWFRWGFLSVLVSGVPISAFSPTSWPRSTAGAARAREPRTVVVELGKLSDSNRRGWTKLCGMRRGCPGHAGAGGRVRPPRFAPSRGGT